MSEVKVDTISERTAANGVAVDGVTIKDGGLTIPSGGTLTIDSGGTITNNGTASGLGGLILLSESTNSSSVSELVFTIPNLTDYRFYYFYFTDFTFSAASYLRMQISTDGGSTFITSGYAGSPQGESGNLSLNRADVQADNAFGFYNFGMYLFPRNDESVAYGTGISIQSGIFQSNSNGAKLPVQAYFHADANSTTSSFNAFKIYMSSGNITAGKFKLYGVVD